VLSLALCVACLYALFLELPLLAGALFAGALMLPLRQGELSPDLGSSSYPIPMI